MLGLNTLAGGKEGGELKLTVKSIRELADDLDKRTGALIADGRRTLGDISRAVNNLDRNPSAVMFGGSNNAAPQRSRAADPTAAPSKTAAAVSLCRRPSRRRAAVIVLGAWQPLSPRRRGTSTP